MLAPPLLLLLLLRCLPALLLSFCLLLLLLLLLSRCLPLLLLPLLSCHVVPSCRSYLDIWDGPSGIAVAAQRCTRHCSRTCYRQTNALSQDDRRGVRSARNSNAAVLARDVACCGGGAGGLTTPHLYPFDDHCLCRCCCCFR